MVATGYLKVQVLEHEQRLNPNTEFKHMMKHPVRDLKKKKKSLTGCLTAGTQPKNLCCIKVIHSS